MNDVWRESATSTARRTHVSAAARAKVVPQFVIEERRRERAERKRLMSRTLAADGQIEEATS